jgi:hypothetical protein
MKNPIILASSFKINRGKHSLKLKEFFSATTFSITTFGLATLSTMSAIMTLSINVTQHKPCGIVIVMLGVFTLFSRWSLY